LVVGEVGRIKEAKMPFDIDDVFSYHATEADQIPKYKVIRAKAKEFAQVLIDNCPSCADRSAALRLLRESVMTANASIALKGSV